MSAERPSRRRLYLLLSLMVLFWSFNYVVGKVALRQFPPLMLAGFRTALAGALLLPVFAWRKRHQAGAWDWRGLRVLAPFAILGLAGNQILFVMGLARTSVAHAGIVIAMTPILVLLLAAMVGQEELNARKAAGAAVAFSGIVILQLGRARGSNATLGGDLLVLCGAVALASFTVFGKSVSQKYGGVTVNTIAYAGGGLLLAPLLWYQGLTFPLASITPLGWWSVLYMAAFSSVISYLIYYHALKHISASRVSGLSYLQPVLATLMAVPILREPVSPSLLAGGSLALAGVYLAERRR